MKKWRAVALRRRFLDFFEARLHRVLPSAPLIPTDDPTLLFTNSGMAPLKQHFLHPTDQMRRAASVQLCMRAGGKHNDLDDVGYDDWHLTCFEMLGYFSFGDYFKRDAIRYAFDFLTQVLQLPRDRLWVSVFKEDTEAVELWRDEIGIDPARLVYGDQKDNFWSMGETGPAGPCSEIFYDRGPAFEGGPPGSTDQEGGRYLEIWNLVFTQYNQKRDGTLEALSQCCVDTGMGLERMLLVLQNVPSVYETDLLQPLIKTAASLTGCKDHQHSALKVLADHIRAASFMIAEGLVPSHEGRAYVLRRIIRRALRHAHRLGVTPPFFYRLLPALVTKMGEAYPLLAKEQARIADILKQEETQFSTTLAQGMAIFQKQVQTLSSDVIPGALVFQLYDTYGFPKEVTADMAREQGLGMDEPGFEEAMQAQRTRSREARCTKTVVIPSHIADQKTAFVGYTDCAVSATIQGCIEDGQSVDQLELGASGIVLLDRTPFYAEGGGQAGDTGLITAKQGVFEVQDTQRQGIFYLHEGVVKQGVIRTHQSVKAVVSDTRQAIACHHSATHLLHAALRDVLGDNVVQKGSWVTHERLRFDFTHSHPMDADQCFRIEKWVNAAIRANHAVKIALVSLEEAKARGALALFERQYEEAQVRLLQIGDCSLELCGGTHVAHTGELGFFKIISETGIASGVRRIEAMVGETACDWAHQKLALLAHVSKRLGVDTTQCIGAVEGLYDTIKQSKQRYQALARDALVDMARRFLSEGTAYNRMRCVVRRCDGFARDMLRALVDEMKKQDAHAVVLLASVEEGGVVLVSGSRVAGVDAVQLLRSVAEPLGGKGGGRSDMAQGGAPNSDHLEQVLAEVKTWLKQQGG